MLRTIHVLFTCAVLLAASPLAAQNRGNSAQNRGSSGQGRGSSGQSTGDGPGNSQGRGHGPSSRAEVPELDPAAGAAALALLAGGAWLLSSRKRRQAA